MSCITREEFLAQFRFRPEYVGFTGVELELYLVDPRTGMPVPRAKEFLDRINGRGWCKDTAPWVYELGACQVEFRTPPLRTEQAIRESLEAAIGHGRQVAAQMGLRLTAYAAAPAEMPLEIYPDDRFPAIIARWEAEGKHDRVVACCRVAGVHLHLGMSSMAMALHVYGRLQSHTERLLTARAPEGQAERVELFQLIYDRLDPVRIPDVDELWRLAISADRPDAAFKGDLAAWYSWLRMTRYGTVEARHFGATDDVDRILGWRRETFELAGMSEYIHPERIVVAMPQRCSSAR